MDRAEGIRYVVAAGFVACGAGLVICANRADHLQTLHGYQYGWVSAANGFAIGLLAFLVATAALIIDAVVRFAFKLGPSKIRFGLQTLLIAMTLFAVFFALVGVLIR